MFFTATDIANFVACRHLLTLKLDAAEGKIQKPYFHDLGVELLRELGERHEAAYFNQLASKPGCRVVSIPTDVEWTEAVDRTKEAIRDGMGLAPLLQTDAGRIPGSAFKGSSELCYLLLKILSLRPCVSAGLDPFVRDGIGQQSLKTRPFTF
jgi:hypothetical protein